ncbi:helix-turn-helix domain-containing protein [Enterococcus mundtii]|uniref:HTH domain-containing protein n=1 Tax=Enterococcus mundtii TaxID=53346 RepID=A0A242KUR7_ENTMU|nr:helix-turn-helix domain-containing protein [Enterococcus mundtii]OTP24881.1 hypothetical protein A5802_003036 [Enterococcus mundtii]
MSKGEYMRKILNKVDQRHLKILELLWEKGWKSLSEIAKEINVTERTLKKDIKVINSFIQPLYLETNNKTEVYLYTHLEKGKSFLYSKILERSWEFSLIECSFFEKFNDLYEFCEMNFMSEGTTKRTIGKINKILKEKGISFNSDGHLIGSEILLRNFMVQFMMEKYEDLSYVCDQDKMHLIDELVQNFMAKNKSIVESNFFHHRELNRLKMSIYLSIRRIQLGKYIQQNTIDEDFPSIIFYCEEKFIDKFGQHFNIFLTKEIHQDLFYLAIEQLQIINFDDLLLLIENNKEKQTILKNSLKLIHDLEQKFDILCTDKERLLIKFYRVIIASGPSYIIYDKIHEFFEGVSEECNFIIDFLEKKINDFLLEGKKNNPLSHQIIFELLTNWNGLLEKIKTFMPKIYACLLLNSSREHAEFLKEKLEYHLKPYFKFEIAFITTIENLEKNTKKYDCILTNNSCLNVPNNVQIISISNYINASEIDVLIKFYENKVKSCAIPFDTN